MTVNASISERHRQFVTALMAHETIKHAAETCNISEATAHRWLKLPAVRDHYREELKELHQRNMDKLVKAEILAINTLIRSLEARSELVRVTAATKLLELAMERYKQTELEDVLAELKEHIPHGRLRTLN